MAEKILVFTYNYVPYNVTGTFRIMRFVKHFPRNDFIPVVFTAEQGSENTSEILNNEIPSNAEIVRSKAVFLTKDKLGTGERKLYSKEKNYLKSALKYIVRFAKDLLLSPDKRILWVLKNITKIVKIIRENKIKYLYVNCDPFSLAVGGVIIKKITGVKLVIDFRDPWTSNPSQLKQTYIRRKLNRIYEKSCVQNADLIVAVTQPIIDELRKNYVSQCDFLVIPNGFDPDDYSSLKKAEPDNTFSFIYGGKINFSSHYYNPEKVIEGFRLFQEKYAVNDAKLIFYSSASDETKKAIKKMDVSNIVVNDFIERKKLVNILNNAGAFIQFFYPIPSPGSISIKIFEYAVLAKPILSFNSSKGCISDFLSESKTGFSCDNNDVEKIADMYYKAYCTNIDKFKQDINHTFINQYNVNNLTKKLSETVRKLTKD